MPLVCAIMMKKSADSPFRGESALTFSLALSLQWILYLLLGQPSQPSVDAQSAFWQLAVSHAAPSQVAASVATDSAASAAGCTASTGVVFSPFVSLLLALPPHATKASEEAKMMADKMTFFILVSVIGFLFSVARAQAVKVCCVSTSLVYA